jgi:hypothetical protein
MGAVAPGQKIRFLPIQTTRLCKKRQNLAKMRFLFSGRTIKIGML